MRGPHYDHNDRQGRTAEKLTEQLHKDGPQQLDNIEPYIATGGGPEDGLIGHDLPGGAQGGGEGGGGKGRAAQGGGV
jgi:hypothetical protein